MNILRVSLGLINDPNNKLIFGCKESLERSQRCPPECSSHILLSYNQSLVESSDSRQLTWKFHKRPCNSCEDVRWPHIFLLHASYENEAWYGSCSTIRVPTFSKSQQSLAKISLSTPATLFDTTDFDNQTCFCRSLLTCAWWPGHPQGCLGKTWSFQRGPASPRCHGFFLMQVSPYGSIVMVGLLWGWKDVPVDLGMILADVTNKLKNSVKIYS